MKPTLDDQVVIYRKSFRHPRTGRLIVARPGTVFPIRIGRRRCKQAADNGEAPKRQRR